MLTAPGRRAWSSVATVMAAAVIAAVLPLLAATPAQADIVRDKQQWVLDDLGLPQAWQVTQGRGVLVAVIDSGVDPAVSDLTGSVTTGPDLTGVHTTVANPNWGAHGTWMASLIAGHGHGAGDADGVMGVAPQARILSIRVITDRSDPGYATYQNEVPGRGQRELAAAIRYAVAHHAKVISMSLGYNEPSLVVRSALQYAMTRNVVVVASSGNAGSTQMSHGHGHAPYSFPADYPGVIGVAAVGRSGLPAYFSSDNLSVQVAAPGVNVPAEGRDSLYWTVSGTSPACALTAGVAALVRAKYPRLTGSQVRRAIIWSAANRPPGGYDDEIGFGTVDASSALRFAGRLARHDALARPGAARVAAARFFGGGPAGVPPVPVAPRGARPLLTWCALALAFLLVTVASFRRLATGLARSRAPRGVLGGSPPGLAQGVLGGSPPGLAQGVPEGPALGSAPRYAAEAGPPWPPVVPRADYWQPGPQAFGYGSREAEGRGPSSDPI